jgi:lipoprotein-releasing system ATP-binding protein
MLLNLNNITKSYGNAEDNTNRTVLDKLCMEVEEGDSVALLGPSGSGKTTLLNMIGALDHPDTGSVIFKDKNITDLKGKDLDHFRNREIGFVFQNHHLLPQCTLIENVLIPTLVNTDKEQRDVKRREAEVLLKQVGIWEHKDKLPSKMSGGECQRAAVVRAMINQPSLLLADEPTGALDRLNVESMADLLIQLNKDKNLTLIIVTHSEKLASKMNKTYHLSDGKIK